jgi:ABC transporter transmembrane region
VSALFDTEIESQSVKNRIRFSSMTSTAKRGSESSLLVDQGTKAVSVIYFFHEVQSSDLLVLIVGVVCCVGTAASSAIFCFILGFMLDSLNGDTKLVDVNYLLYILVAVAFGTGILGWCGAISWTVLSENQALKFREKYVKLLLSHDARR